MLKSMRGQKGISTVELIPVLLLFALLFNFSLGFFGVIHSGILNSIAARNYAFETFRNRANLTYLRDVDVGQKDAFYTKMNFRFHGITSEGHTDLDWYATQRPIKFTDLKNGVENKAKKEDHGLVRQVADTGKASDVFTGKTPEDGRNGTSPVWIRVLYGICLNSKCGPSSN